MGNSDSNYSEPQLASGGFESGGVFRVVESGEWEGLLGLFEGFLDADLGSVEELPEDGFVQLFFPVGPSAQRKYGLYGVNDYPSGVLAQLRDLSFVYHFRKDAIEPADPEDF